jgi:DNA repair protein RecO (recombination protein O)
VASRSHRSAAAAAAYVLHHYDWSESSLILDVFTRDRGRLAVAAKGAKRPHSQLRSVLLPFQRILLTLGRPPAGEGESAEVQVMRSAEWAGGRPMLAGAALFSGFYVNELLMKLLGRDDPHPALFDAYAATLDALAVAADDLDSQAALRAFEAFLLRELGVLPELNVVTLTQQAVTASGRYSLRPEAGVIEQAAADDASIAGATLVQLEAALAHGSAAAVQQASRAALGELRAALRTCLHYHLGSSTLRTRQVMIDVQKLSLERIA